MDEDLQKKTYEEIAALKDLFLRRLMDDKVKTAALLQLKESNDALQRQLDERAISSFVKEILLICDRIDAQKEIDELTESVEEEILETLAHREFYKMDTPVLFDPLIHNAVGTVEETEEHPEKRIVRVIRNGYYFKDKVFRAADVIVAVKKKQLPE